MRGKRPHEVSCISVLFYPLTLRAFADQLLLLLPRKLLYPLLFQKRVSEIPVFLIPDQFDGPPVARIFRSPALIMQLDPVFKIGRVAGVKTSVAALDDIYVK